MTNRKLPILLIGPRKIAGDVLGGTKVSFELLVEHFERSSRWEPLVVSLSRRSSRSRMVAALAQSTAFVSVIWHLVRTVRRSAIVFMNVSSRGLLHAGPLVWLITRISRRPIVFRVFGGDFSEQLGGSGIWTRWVARRTFLRADLLLFQTRSLVAEFDCSCEAYWYPTSRPASDGGRVRRECRKVLFASQLRAEKGIRELIQAASELPSEVSISVFGPRMSGFDPAEFEGIENIAYHGEVSNDVVLAAMQEHDAFVIPTYYDGEGYPGVVIEAMQAGMPVIATRWKSLTELVEHENNGLLVAPRSSSELADAIVRLAHDSTLVSELSTAALSTGTRYTTEALNNKLDSVLANIVQERGSFSCAA